ncbi:MAG TPA: hypothetical protein ENN69_03465 [Spirochaetia bacterium]|nr:hypothetical protein [Spirochaetia bacterium]
MPLYCDVNDTTYRFAIEAIPLTTNTGLDQYNLLKTVISTTSQIKDQYDHTMARYGKLIGQGRIGLLEQLDNLFINLLLLYENLKQSTRDQYLAFQKKFEFKVMIDNKNNKYYSSGIISERDVALPNNFGQAYNELIVGNIKRLLVRYKEVMNNPAQAENLTDIYAIMDQVLYQFIILRYNVLKCNIDK